MKSVECGTPRLSVAGPGIAGASAPASTVSWRGLSGHHRGAESQGQARLRRTPFGWRLLDGGFEQTKGDRSKMVKHQEEQRVLKQMLRLRRKELGARRIAVDVNQRSDSTEASHPKAGSWCGCRGRRELERT